MSAEQLGAVQSNELSAVMGPYVGVAIILSVLWIAIKVTAMPTASDESISVNLMAAFRRLMHNRNYVWAVVAQFFYVGAQIGVWSFTIRLVMQELDVNEEQASSYYLGALVLFLLSRFVCTWLMKFIKPSDLLTLLAVLAMGLTLITIMAQGYTAVYSLMGISACMSLMFPTIYALGLAGLGEDTKIGGSGLIMAILGGAVITGIQGIVSDTSGSIQIAYAVPLCCFGVVAYYGRQANRSG